MWNKIFWGAIFLAAVAGLALTAIEEPEKEEGTAIVCFGEKCVEAEIAKTQQERSQGLMFRESLKKGRGMLFVFPEEGQYSFWMKNTLIPLAVVWINREMEVVHIAYAEPCKSDPCKSYRPKKDALYVLEVRPEFAEANIRLGGLVEIKK